MSVKEMKETLIKRIEASENEALLEMLVKQTELLRDESKEPVYKLSETQKVHLRKVQKQVARGEYFTQEEVDQEFDQWMQEEEKKWVEK